MGYGAYTGSYLIMFLGSLGIFTAWYKPAQRLEKLIKNRLLAKQQSGEKDLQHIQATEEFYAEHISTESQPAPAATGFTGGLQNGGLYLHTSKFNVLKAPHLNLYQEKTQSPWH